MSDPSVTSFITRFNRVLGSRTGRRALARACVFSVALVGASRLPATGAEPSLIEVQITHLRDDRGQVLCALFSSAANFPRDYERAMMRDHSLIAEGRAHCEFRDVPPGTYAVAVIHDENSNGKLDTTFLGIPKEGVGTSNNARGHFGPPRFRDAAFAYQGEA